MNPNTIKEGKKTAIIAYFTMIGALISITMNLDPKNEFARFHIRQAFGLHLIFIAGAIFINQWSNIFVLGGLYLFYIVSWGFGFIAALNEQPKLVPVVGIYFQKWFTFIQ